MRESGKPLDAGVGRGQIVTQRAVASLSYCDEISHDRWFIQRFGGEVWELADGHLVHQESRLGG